MKKLKQIIAAAVVSVIVVCCVPVTAAEVSVYVDNVKIEFDQQPVIENSRTLVPLRAIFEALGADVEWIDEIKTVFASKRFDIISLQIGSSELYKNGEAVYVMDVPAKIENSRTLVPVRAVSEAFGCYVAWDDSVKTVYITTKPERTKITDRYIKTQLKAEDGTVLLNGKVSYPQLENSVYSEQTAVLNEAFRKTAEDYIESLSNEPLSESAEAYSQAKEIGIEYMPSEFERIFNITYNYDNLISVTESFYENVSSYAYPKDVMISSTYDLSTGKPAELTDIFNMTEEEIVSMITETYTSIINEQPEMYYENAVQIIEENAKTVNFYLEASGIHFFMQKGLIAPNMADYPGFSIAYNENFKKDFTMYANDNETAFFIITNVPVTMQNAVALGGEIDVDGIKCKEITVYEDNSENAAVIGCYAAALDLSVLYKLNETTNKYEKIK